VTKEDNNVVAIAIILYCSSISLKKNLDSRRIQHLAQLDPNQETYHSTLRTKALWWKIRIKFCSYNTTSSMTSRNPSPNNTNARPVNLTGGLVHIRNTFSHVEFRLGGNLHALELEKRGVFSDVSLATTERDDSGFGIESVRTGVFCLMGCGGRHSDLLDGWMDEFKSTMDSGFRTKEGKAFFFYSPA
jgi:hypothetical protein